MTRPVIGVTTSRRSGWRIFPLVALNLWIAGARAVRWVTHEDADVAAVDGILIGGGDDISPDLYGGRLITSARLDTDRDALERELVFTAFEQGKPVLGICRGSQMINVASGGDLHQDAYGIYEASQRYWTILPRKRVNIIKDSKFAGIVGGDQMLVNALHGQAVDQLGNSIRIAARDEGGMIQAIERTTDPFALGVQWHPEHLVYARRQRAIFRALVEAASAYRHREDQISAVRSRVEC